MNRYSTSKSLLLAFAFLLLGQGKSDEPVRVDCAAFPGDDAGQKIRACLVALPDHGGIADARSLTGPQVISATVRVDRPAQLLFGAMLLTYTGADPGIAHGIFDLASDDVSITGAGSATVFVNAPNAQTMFQIGAHQRITFSKFKIDGREAAHTNVRGFYSGIRSSAGAADIRIEEMEFTAAGDRAIDLRGTARVWIRHNYFHQTGINIAGQDRARGGNAVSVDVDGKVHSTDTWCEFNYAEEWGDSFQCGNEHVHIRNNTLVGRAAFGNAPSQVEAGLDASGVAGGEITGNVVLQVRGPNLAMSASNTGLEVLVPQDVRVEDNIFRTTSNLLASTDPRVSITQAGRAVQLRNIIFRNNTLQGVRLTVGGIEGLIVDGNTFLNLTNSKVRIAVDFNEVSGGVMRRFQLVKNIFQTTDGSLRVAFNIGPGVQSADDSRIEDNICPPAVGQEVAFQNAVAKAQIQYRKSLP